MNIHYEDGWVGAFTRDTAAKALPNGTRITKANSEAHDSHPDGTLGTVLGSLRAPEELGQALIYFIEWDPSPRAAIACMATKVQA